VGGAGTPAVPAGPLPPPPPVRPPACVASNGCLPAGSTSLSKACHSPDPMLSSVGPPWEPEPAPDIEGEATRRKGPAALEHDCMPFPICGCRGLRQGSC
jgi:hypothetical protein